MQRRRVLGESGGLMVVGEMGIRVRVRKWVFGSGTGNGVCHFMVVFRDLRRDCSAGWVV